MRTLCHNAGSCFSTCTADAWQALSIRDKQHALHPPCAVSRRAYPLPEQHLGGILRLHGMGQRGVSNFEGDAWCSNTDAPLTVPKVCRNGLLSSGEAPHTLPSKDLVVVRSCPHPGHTLSPHAYVAGVHEGAGCGARRCIAVV